MSFTAIAGLTLVVAMLGAGTASLLRSREKTRRRCAVAEFLHELRGALSALQLGLSAPEAPAQDQTIAADRLDALRTQTERASGALEDLDDHLRGKARDSSASTHELVELGAIVRRRTLAWDRLAYARGGGVGLRWPLGPAVVRADPKRLCQALDNLIANGLDHGGGLVTLAGSLENEVVRITVSDRGPGLTTPLEKLPRARWDSRHGHGLAIVRRAVELHRGRLHAISRAGGTNVEIVLPLAGRDARSAP